MAAIKSETITHPGTTAYITVTQTPIGNYKYIIRFYYPESHRPNGFRKSHEPLTEEEITNFFEDMKNGKFGAETETVSI